MCTSVLHFECVMQESVYLAALVSQRWMSGRAEPPDIYLGCTKTSKGGTKGMLDRVGEGAEGVQAEHGFC